MTFTYIHNSTFIDKMLEISSSGFLYTVFRFELVFFSATTGRNFV